MVTFSAKEPVWASAVRWKAKVFVPKPPRCQQSARLSAFASSSSDGFRRTFGPLRIPTAVPETPGFTGPPITSATVCTVVPESAAWAWSQSRNCPRSAGSIVYCPQLAAGEQIRWKTSCTQPPPEFSAWRT